MPWFYPAELVNPWFYPAGAQLSLELTPGFILLEHLS